MDKGYYPDVILNELKQYTVGTLDEVTHTYSFIKDTISSFDGNAEKFYPTFYKCVSDADDLFRGLSKNCSLLLGFEVANHVLAFLSGVRFEEEVLSFDSRDIKFSEKEKSIIGYLSGYVFGTMYRRIRFTKTSGIYHQQCMSILLAGQSQDTNDLPEHKLVNTRNRSGLWKVTSDVINIFILAEATFQSVTKKCVNKIDSKEIVNYLRTNSGILSTYSKIRSQASLVVRKEVAMNLLEDLLMLYVRTRTFSLVKDKLQLHKMKSTQVKSKSLRTDLKQKSAKLDQGH